MSATASSPTSADTGGLVGSPASANGASRPRMFASIQVQCHRSALWHCPKQRYLLRLMGSISPDNISDVTDVVTIGDAIPCL